MLSGELDEASDDVDPELELEKLASDQRLARWQEAARLVELSTAEWIVVTLDRAAAIRRHS